MRFFDLRLPLGWLFAVVGLLLVVAGLRASPAADARSLGININLIWGVAMIAFALFCLWLSRREARRRMAAPPEPGRHYKNSNSPDVEP
ncbi:MAG: hypothetical protein WCE51_14710 [Chthoniobacterales bacterium]